MTKLELHGRGKCPFAWRTRIAAFEKGLAFDWIPFDVPSPDPRAATHNADKKSPRLVDGEFSLTESLVIAQYLSEAYPGPTLEPIEPRARALLREIQAHLAKFQGDLRPDQPISDEQLNKLQQAFDQLEAVLADGRAFVGGSEPSIADIQLWPFINGWISKGIVIPPNLARVAAYWARVEARPSFVQTRPT